MKSTLAVGMIMLMAMAGRGQNLLSGPNDTTKFIQGFNWGSVSAQGLDTSKNVFKMNVVHARADLLHPDTMKNSGVKLLYVDTHGDFRRGGWDSTGPLLNTNPFECERMTIYPSAPANGQDSSAFCFRSCSGHQIPINTGLQATHHSELKQDSIVTFSNIQYGTNQWYQDTSVHQSWVNLDTFYLTLRALKKSDAAHAADTLFLVTVHRMLRTPIDCHPDSSRNHDDTSFAFTAGMFPAPSPSTQPTEVTDTFPWKHINQFAPYNHFDSTDIVVQWTGKCNADFYFVRLENKASLAFFSQPDSGALYNAIKSRMSLVRDSNGIDSAIYRLYTYDEGPPSIYEALRKHNGYMQRAQNALGKKDTIPVSSELSGEYARSFQGVAESKETWIGTSLAASWTVAPQVDYGFAGYSNNDSIAKYKILGKGNGQGYRGYYDLSNADWRHWASTELGNVGLQANIGMLVKRDLMHGATLRQRGLRWWSNPFIHGSYNRSDTSFHNIRVPVTSEIRALFNLSLAFGATGIIPYTLQDADFSWDATKSDYFVCLLRPQ